MKKLIPLILLLGSMHLPLLAQFAPMSQEEYESLADKGWKIILEYELQLNKLASGIEAHEQDTVAQLIIDSLSTGPDSYAWNDLSKRALKTTNLKGILRTFKEEFRDKRGKLWYDKLKVHYPCKDKETGMVLIKYDVERHLSANKEGIETAYVPIKLDFHVGFRVKDCQYISPPIITGIHKHNENPGCSGYDQIIPGSKNLLNELYLDDHSRLLQLSYNRIGRALKFFSTYAKMPKNSFEAPVYQDSLRAMFAEDGLLHNDFAPIDRQNQLTLRRIFHYISKYYPTGLQVKYSELTHVWTDIDEVSPEQLIFMFRVKQIYRGINRDIDNHMYDARDTSYLNITLKLRTDGWGPFGKGVIVGIDKVEPDEFGTSMIEIKRNIVLFKWDPFKLSRGLMLGNLEFASDFTSLELGFGSHLFVPEFYQDPFELIPVWDELMRVPALPNGWGEIGFRFYVQSWKKRGKIKQPADYLKYSGAKGLYVSPQIFGGYQQRLFDVTWEEPNSEPVFRTLNVERTIVGGNFIVGYQKSFNQKNPTGRFILDFYFGGGVKFIRESTAPVEGPPRFDEKWHPHSYFVLGIKPGWNISNQSHLSKIIDPR